MIMLTSKERDQGVYALSDIFQHFYQDPRKVGYDDLDEVQTILASRGLIIGPLNPPKAVAPAAPARPAAPGQINAIERAAIDTLWAGAVDMERKRDFLAFKATQMKFALTLLYRLLGVKK